MIQLTRRIAKLEKSAVLRRDNRIIVRYEGPGSERMPPPSQEDIDSGAEILTVCFVAAKDGRPA